jgi:hypothetical protein
LTQGGVAHPHQVMRRLRHIRCTRFVAAYVHVSVDLVHVC